MKKLLLMLFALITTGAWAQTDVTSTYLTNADFEGEYSVYSNPKSDRAIYQPTGWTVAYSNGDVNDMTALNSSCLAWNNFSSRTQPTNGGNNTYWIRFRWGNSENLQLSQTKTLPSGYYTLSADALHTGGATATISAGGNTTTIPAGSSWSNYSVSFSLEADTEVTFAFKLQQTSTTESVLAIDNFKLTWTDPEAAAHAAALEAAKYSLNGYIKKATALNGVLANATLTTAISIAQGVYDAANDWAEDYDNTVSASSTLNTEITTALSGATTVSLVNANFDTNINIAADGTSTATFIEPATEAKPYIYAVTGWTQNFTFSSTAAQGTTAAYGATITGDKGNNGTNPPAYDMFTNTAGGALHLSSGWSDQARYKQEIKDLPAGRYVFYYEANNQNSSANTIYSNYFGVSGTAGDFYKSTNSFVYSDVKTFAYNTWTANAIEFDLAKKANITFHVGVVGTTGGSATGAKLWIDNVQVYRIGDITMTDAEAEAILAQVAELDGKTYNADKKSALTTAKSTFEANKTLDNYNALNEALIAAKASVETYKTLDKAITNIEEWTSNKATVTDPIRAKYTNGEYADETTDANIYEAYQAAEIAALAGAEATDYTSAILNPSFETGDMTGWSAESRNDVGVKENSNGTYATTGADGNYLFNSWGGTAENNVYQTIKGLPAGTYTLSALLAGFNGEELVLAANETTNSVTVAGDKTVGYTATVVFTLDEAGDVVIKASNTKSQSTSDASFIKADNFTLKAYSDPLAALKEQLATLQAEATEALNDEVYENVTGSEKTNLNTLATTTPEDTEESYNTAISDITAAISAFKNAKASYDAFYAIANSDYVTTLDYGTEEKRQALEEACSVEPTSAADAVVKTNAVYTALRTYYESHALAEGVEGSVDYAGAIADADPETNKGWTGGIGVDNRDAEKYTNADGSKSGKYYDGGWSQNAGANINMTREISVPAGKYLLTVTARGSMSLTEYNMSIGDKTVTLPQNGSGVEVGVFGHGWDDVSIEFESDGHPLTLRIKATSTEYQQWVSFNRFRLVQLEQNNDAYAGETEYAALNAAIAAAEAKTLGFQNGEFAPYNNVEALQALAAAKAIDQTAELTNLKTDVETATAALTDATWTANDGDVDAIYNGMFATVTEGANYPDGWARTNAWGQMQSGIEGDYATAYYNQPGSLQYGKQGVYTMPLAANTAYKLTFAYRSHENNSNNGVTVSVLNGEDGLVATTFDKNGSTSEWVAATAYFTTGAAGKYVLTLANNGNTWMTNVSLVKIASAELALNEGVAYEAIDRTYYESVTMNRKVVEGINAVSVPFDLTTDQVKAVFGENAQVYTFEDVPSGENSQINFNTKEENTIEANVPVLVGGATASTSQTINGVILKAGEARVKGTNFDFVGNYAGTVKVAANDYFISGGKLYKSAGNTNLKSFRAYIQNMGEATGEVKLYIDGVATSIDEIVNGQSSMVNGNIYNLAGQRVSKATRGIYVKNGRKVVIK